MITQGDWKIHREPLNSPQPEYIYGGPDSTHICDFRKLNPNLIDEVLEQQRDIAALIAAAPKLLTMCKEIDEIIDYDGELTNQAVTVIKDLKALILTAENK